MVKIFWIAVAASTLTLGWSAAAQSPTPKELPTVTVSRDGRALEIQRDSDPAPVRVPVLDRCGDPLVGEAKITHIELTKQCVNVRYGKHCYAKVDLKTLAVECVGCD
ncbi:MAG: hypothetical protein QOC96_2070 [Acidobacteriota bacterium]|nr:hypothetical protein [Acidobacteriota bacterium]